jgi:hypothetical protein
MSLYVSSGVVGYYVKSILVCMQGVVQNESESHSALHLALCNSAYLGTGITLCFANFMFGPPCIFYK